MPDSSISSSDYADWLGDVKLRVQSAQISAARSVNRELILLYWDIGRAIVEKQDELGWGDSVVDQLSKDLGQEFPQQRGFSKQNVWRMRQFYLTHTSEEFLSQAVRELVSAVRWGHHANVLAKIESPAERLYYLRATAQFGWTRAVLLNQVKANAYDRSLAEGKAHNFPAALPESLADQAEEILKSSYNLEFLGIEKEVRERELEDRLVEKLKDFILELGYGFCFIGRQHRILLGKKEYFIDLLFYHRFLKCLVAVELKIGEFQPEYAGKMDFYLNVLNEKERAPDDNPTIGIILCAEKDDVEVGFALKSKGNPIGVAEYQLNPNLPNELKGKIPTAKELGEAIGLPPKKT